MDGRKNIGRPIKIRPTLGRMLRYRPEDVSGHTPGHLIVGQRCRRRGEEWIYDVFCSECRKSRKLTTSEVKAGACCLARCRTRPKWFMNKLDRHSIKSP